MENSMSWTIHNSFKGYFISMNPPYNLNSGLGSRKDLVQQNFSSINKPMKKGKY
jgi:hypothetical protein